MRLRVTKTGRGLPGPYGSRHCRMRKNCGVMPLSEISASTLITMKKSGDGTGFLKAMSIVGIIFSVTFIILQLVPIPGLSGVNFGKESYIMLGVWVFLGLLFYAKQIKTINRTEND